MNAGKTRRRAVVHGTARRVVIVSQDSTGPFEQAIFVVRGSSSLSEDELLEQAAALVARAAGLCGVDTALSAEEVSAGAGLPDSAAGVSLSAAGEAVAWAACSASFSACQAWAISAMFT